MFHNKQVHSVEIPCHLCDPTGPRAEQRRLHTHPVPRGGFHKAGEGPAFGDSFPNFSSLRNWAQRSVPTKMGTFSREIGEEKASRLLLACFSLEKGMHVWYHDKKGG